MIADLTTAAESVGITAVITNSNEKIETQLNRITGIESLPLMLISWDLETSLEFNEHGYLKNPSTNIVCLLMDKAIDTTKEEGERTAEEMGALYQSFIQALYQILLKYRQGEADEMLSSISYTLAPKHGLGKHSGILGRFTMLTQVSNC